MAKLAETRITGGEWRGRRIVTPKGFDVLRPTRGMVRQARVDLIAADAVPWLRRRPVAALEADVCFVDAPYQDDEMLAALRVLGDLAPPLIVCEHHRARPMPDTLGTMAAVRTAHYGLTDLTMYRPQDRERTDP